MESGKQINDNVQLVIARYKENLSWLLELSFSAIVYDKSGDDGDIFPANIHSSRNFALHRRTNIGREAETWLYHIVSHYDNLAHYTVFLQGNPFDHMDVKTPRALDDYITKHILTTSSGVVGAGRNHLHTEYRDAYSLPTSATFNSLFTAPCPHHFEFIPGAQYIVQKDVILSRPIEFYQMLHMMIMQETATHYHDVCYCPNKIDAWTIERLWMYIWDPSLPLHQ